VIAICALQFALPQVIFRCYDRARSKNNQLATALAYTQSYDMQIYLPETSRAMAPMRRVSCYEKRLCTAQHCEAEPFTDLPRDADD
jgi:outer membrane phospholipase A